MTIRAFFAVEVKEQAIINKLVKFQEEFDLPGSRFTFVQPENFHFTLKFLGDIEERLVPKLEAAAKKISFDETTLRLQGAGCLPSYRYINAIYVDVSEGASALAALAKNVRVFCTEFGFKKEKRSFRPHLTVSRAKRLANKQAVIDIIESYKEASFGDSMLASFALKKSVLTPKGPIYSTLFEVPAQK